MIRQGRRNLLRQLTFSLTLLIASVAATTAATTTVPTTSAIRNQQTLTNSVNPTGIFSQQAAPILDDYNLAYDDYDFYVPYRSDVHDHFSWQLLKEVLQEENNNVMISPFSIKLVLALISEAAGNNTKTQEELVSSLTDIKSPDNVRGYYKKFLTSLKKENPYLTINLETKLYTDAFIEPQQRYAALLHTFYDTDIERLNFADSSGAANVINAWCSNVTRGRLQQLVNEGNIRNNVMLMANAIYFNGLWRRPFNETFSSVFFRTPTQQIKAEYMEQTEYFYYHDSSSLDVKILRLPYKGKKLSMFVLLPKTKGGVDELTSILENDQLKRMQWMMEEVKVKLTLPKFKFDFNKNFKRTLNKLGINDIFTDSASLPGLARGADVAGKLKVSNIFQKSGIEVNERGTEAYASTVLEIENKFGGNDIVEFNVNRPFIFFIEEESSGNIIFAGKVLDPLA